MKPNVLSICVFLLSVLPGCNSGPSEHTKPGNPETNSSKISPIRNKKPAFKDEAIDEQSIKELVGFNHEIGEFLCWSDPEGKHIVFTNETGVFHTNIRENGDLFDQNAEVSCYHYIQKIGQENFEKSWKIFDYSRDCPVDACAVFKNNTLQKTDLNKNGIAEIWMMYSTFCKGDVSPSKLKIIMYEGSRKYKMTGETLIKFGENESYGGEIRSEGDFKENPEFLKFAKTLWKNNRLETFGE